MFDLSLTTSQTSTKLIHKGTGLRLAISYQIIEKRFGNIQFKSELGYGA